MTSGEMKARLDTIGMSGECRRKYWLTKLSYTCPLICWIAGNGRVSVSDAARGSGGTMRMLMDQRRRLKCTHKPLLSLVTANETLCFSSYGAIRETGSVPWVCSRCDIDVGPSSRASLVRAGAWTGGNVMPCMCIGGGGNEALDGPASIGGTGGMGATCANGGRLGAATDGEAPGVAPGEGEANIGGPEKLRGVGAPADGRGEACDRGESFCVSLKKRVSAIGRYWRVSRVDASSDAPSCSHSCAASSGCSAVDSSRVSDCSGSCVSGLASKSAGLDIVRACVHAPAMLVRTS